MQAWDTPSRNRLAPSNAATGTSGATIPLLRKKEKNPFSLDSKTPDWDKFEDFLKGEVRYASVWKQYPSEAAELFEAAKKNAQWRYNNYLRLARQQWGVAPEE